MRRICSSNIWCTLALMLWRRRVSGRVAHLFSDTIARTMRHLSYIARQLNRACLAGTHVHDTVNEKQYDFQVHQPLTSPIEIANASGPSTIDVWLYLRTLLGCTFQSSDTFQLDLRLGVIKCCYTVCRVEMEW